MKLFEATSMFLRRTNLITPPARSIVPASHADNRIFFLDALRGIAALLVVIFHAAGWDSWQPLVATTVDLGHTGVSLFFVISGFVIPISLQRQDLRSFWVRRLLRLYPLYWFVMVLFVGVTLTQGSLLPDEATNTITSQPVMTILANTAMLQYPLGMSNFVPNSWSLVYELCFYGLMSLLLLMRLHRHAVPMVVMLLLLAFFMATSGFITYDSHWGIGLLVTYLSLMFVGVVLHQAHAGELPGWVAGAVVVGAVAVHLASPGPGNLLLARALGVTLFVTGYVLRHRSMPRLLLFLGQVSYSLYLIHMIVIIGLRGVLPDIPLLVLPLAILAAVVVAAGAERWIERPAIALGRRLAQPTRQE